MRAHRPQPLDLLSRPGDRVGGEPAADAADRRAVPEDPLLRQSADGGVAAAPRGGDQSQAGPTAHDSDGLGGLHPGPRTTIAAPDARVYPYLLRDRVLTRVDEV